MNNKEKYISPELEVIVFDKEDVIFSSNDGPFTPNSDIDENDETHGLSWHPGQ